MGFSTCRQRINMFKIALVVCFAAYGGYGLGYSRGYYGKRSADAEPKAEADAYLYGGYGGYRGYGYSGLGHAGYGGYGLGYSRGYYGKRSADAEPKAEADAY